MSADSSDNLQLSKESASAFSTIKREWFQYNLLISSKIMHFQTTYNQVWSRSTRTEDKLELYGSVPSKQPCMLI